MPNPPRNTPSPAQILAENALLKSELARVSAERDQAWEALGEVTKAPASLSSIEHMIEEGGSALERADARLERMRQEAVEKEGLALENASLRSIVEVQEETLSELMAARDALLGRLEETDALYRELKDTYENLSVAFARLMERLKFQNARMWCPKSEHTDASQLSFLSLFNDAEQAAEEDGEAQGQTLEGQEEKACASPRKRGGGRRRLDVGDLSCTVVEHELEDASCPECGHALKDMRVEVTRRLHYRPAELWVEEHRRHVYVCPECSKANARGEERPSAIVRAEVPAAPLGKSPASSDLIAHVVHERYERAMPLRRIELDLSHLGGDISRTDLANWVIASSKLYFIPLADRLLFHLRALEVIHADETSVKVLKEPDRSATSTSYMWVLTSSPPDPPIQLFTYAPTRSSSVIEELLPGWSGFLMTDGYAPYHSLGPGVINVGCLAHVRRKFADIVRVLGKSAEGKVAREAVSRLDQMFALDRGLKNLSVGERKEERLLKLSPLMEAFGIWAGARRAEAADGFALAKALDYALNQWPFVENVLLDGRLELSNNRCERAIRPFTLGRKASLFSDTPKGAAASAACYSIVATARANGLSATRYVEWVLDELASLGAPAGEALDAFMPWALGIPEEIRMDEAERRAAARDGRRLSDPVISQREIDKLVAEANREISEAIG